MLVLEASYSCLLCVINVTFKDLTRWHAAPESGITDRHTKCGMQISGSSNHVAGDGQRVQGVHGPNRVLGWVIRAD